MKTETFTKRTRLPIPAEEAFVWHARPGAFRRLAPPWESIELIRHDGIENGCRAEIRMSLGPFSRRWIAEHRNCKPGRSFQDVQLSGPFAHWTHTHTLEPDGDQACWLEDQIEYALPGGRLGRWVASRLVGRQLERTFAYRHCVTRDDLLTHRRGEKQAMKVLVTGSTGLVGSELVPLLTTGGHNVSRLVRSEPKDESEIRWTPSQGEIDAEGLEGFDAVVHLAGENIAGGRWSVERKQRIRDSRVEGTRTLCKALGDLAKPPRVLVCASAIGYYGDRGDEELDEKSGFGTGFLADVCQEWEEAAEPARVRGIRVVNLRIGVVLSPKGGALATMLTPFKLGAGGVVGSGDQYWSWIAIDDLLGAIHHAIITEELSGAVNAAAPNPVTNREFTKTLGRVLHRPTVLPMPAFAAKLALGEMANELLLASARVVPKRLLESGYEFRFPELEGALRHVLGR